MAARLAAFIFTDKILAVSAKQKLHHTAKSMWTPAYYARMWLWASCPKTASTLLVWVFPPDVEPAAEICSHSDTRASVVLGDKSLAHGRRSSSSQRCLMGLRSGLCRDQFSSPAPNWERHFFMELLCAQECCHVETGNTNCWHKVESSLLSKIGSFPACLLLLFEYFWRPEKVKLLLNSLT